ncbi:hypothetical protein SIM71_22925 [Pseudomonas alcaliphila]|uniref:Morphogenetic protein n=1 Tax=Ectopseudomonas alcaliphila TaxID=101564 RepID=A0ABU4Q613_9GAMM|nr:hypothetical protein [Pseudomonas alcaliphila]MDX5994928.1 hypothetical protein [Pseudomonas alcaliphila]
MKERPILFSAPMVHAILEGRKTVTRRLMKPQPSPCDADDQRGGHLWPSREHQTMLHVQEELQQWTGLAGHACPYGEPGERLWVRETWSDVNLQGAPGIAYRADDEVRDLMEDKSFLDERGAFNYDDPRCKPYHFACWSEDLLAGTEGRWRPSIHMPRWVSRILLEITAVRVERLQDISGDQAEAEGVDAAMCRQFLETSPSRFECKEAVIHGFAGLWASINGNESWHANPWVWVVEFKRVEQSA